MATQRESLATVTAAGLTAILLDSIAGVLCILAFLASIFISLFPYGGIVFGIIGLLISMAVFAFCICQCVFAVNLIRLRRWARVPFLISAGVMCIASLLVIISCFSLASSQ